MCYGANCGHEDNFSACTKSKWERCPIDDDSSYDDESCEDDASEIGLSDEEEE